MDFLEIYCGFAELTTQVRRAGWTAGEGIDNTVVSYGRVWPLEDEDTQRQLAWLVCEGLKPRATHTGTPCTKMCMVGGRTDGTDTALLNQMSWEIAMHQEACGLLASNEQPVGSNLYARKEWARSFGTYEQPKVPWRHVRGAGCQMGLVCPGDRTSGSLPEDDKKYPPMGRPMQKEQEWMANFDIGAMNLKCRNPKCLVGSSHVHQHARGGVKLPEGRWLSLARYSGRYTAELSTLYAECLSQALRKLDKSRTGPSKPTALQQRAGGGGSSTRPGSRAAVSAAGTGRGDARTAMYVLKAGQPESVGEQAGNLEAEFRQEEPEAVRKERQEKLDQDAKEAESVWKVRADKKEWDHVRVDLSVYDHSGVQVKEDPRLTPEYKAKVVEGLGFASEWAVRHPELTEADVQATRETLARKAGAFWLEGSPRTTVRFVQHDTIPTGRACPDAAT